MEECQDKYEECQETESRKGKSEREHKCEVPSVSAMVLV